MSTTGASVAPVTPEIAAVVVATCLAVVAIFQACLALGVPWGRAAYGGQHAAVLPNHLRAASAVAAALWPLLALVVLARAGLDVPSPLPDGDLGPATWVVTGLLAVSVLVNAASRSRLERTLWTPVCVVAAACALVVALS